VTRRVLRAAALLAGLAVLPTAAQESFPKTDGTAVAIFASGCFWCTESDFEKVPGVVEAVSGYIGGTDPDPTYQEVSAGRTGHVEAVRLRYDPKVVTYDELLDVYWHNVDFLDAGGQFCDRGDQYRSAIFVLDETQKQAALESKRELELSGRYDSPVVTKIVEAGTFHPAEDYHQDYYKKNPLRYKFYRYGCGRDARLAELWNGTS
jgi:peptide-methionine (S)-S-oxide reductase